MSGFVLVTGAGAIEDASALQARLAAVHVSFDAATQLPEGVLLFRSNPQLQGADAFEGKEGAFARFTGTFLYREAFGQTALARFLDAFNPNHPSLEGCQGQFCLIVRKASRLFLFTDSLGINKLYRNTANTVFSSLFLGVSEGVAGATIDRQGCYEYAWNGVCMGERTFFNEVRTVRAGDFVEATAPPVTGRLERPELREKGSRHLSATDLVERHVERGRKLFATYAQCFGDRLNLSMSGGYDSRLLLALALDAGLRPRLFSYGQAYNPSDEVAVVERVARGEGLEFECVDKSIARQPEPDAYAETFLQTFGAFDGWKVDGIFDSGVDRLDRQERVRDGRLKVNGSGGEIYRNFFYLGRRWLRKGEYAVRELVWSFYARFDPHWCTAEFVPTDYELAMAAVIQRQVGDGHQRLRREQVELAYPLIRLGYWTARDVQLNQGFGLCLFPFLEPALIKGTCDIPLSLKNYGSFEGRMIRALNARIAAYPSDYGFPLDRDPPWNYRLKSQMTYLRPPNIRRYLYRLKQRHPQPRPCYMETPYLRQVIDPTFPEMQRYFRIAAIHDPEVLNRVATMECHCRRH